jgi:5-methylthioadenosine/S-adenosylhomocysteine deaminase
VVVTRGHRHDLDALQALATRDLRYLGLIGSRAKVARIYDQLLTEGRATLEQLSRVHAPIGLDIGAVTPQEIAVSIAAELVAVRRGKASRSAIADASLRWMPKTQVPHALAARRGCLAARPQRHHPDHERRLRHRRRRRLDRATAASRPSVRFRRLPDSHVIDAAGDYLLPGFVQTHVHLCQTLFRGYADDLALLDWLRTRIWPMEAAHTPRSLAAAAALAASELLLGGTTTVLTMETVHDTDAVFEALEPMGLRAVVGKCMMDADEAVPPRLRADARIDRREPCARRRWHGRGHGRLRAAFAPRFACRARASCCSRWAGSLARNVAAGAQPRLGESRRDGAGQRTHGPVQHRVLRGYGAHRPARLSGALRVGGRPRAGAAGRARRQGAALPGIEPEAGFGPRPGDRDASPRHLGVARRRRRRVQQPSRHVPGDAPGRDAAGRAHRPRGADSAATLAMATREGARALGLDAEIGTIAPGKRADLILVRRGAAAPRARPRPVCDVSSTRPARPMSDGARGR